MMINSAEINNIPFIYLYILILILFIDPMINWDNLVNITFINFDFYAAITEAYFH